LIEKFQEVAWSNRRKEMIKPLFLFLALAGMVLGAPQPDLVKIYKKVGGHELKLHIFNPDGHKAGDQRPAIVFFFGGGWNGGSPTQFYPQSEYLASRGMVAISAEYRVKNRHKTSPLECVKDGNSAIRWVRAHAGELGIDPKKIAAGGGSAGGHVAAAIGTTKGIVEEGEDPTVSSRPDALVLFNPVFDNGPKGYGHDRVKAYWKKISPFHNLDKTTPPTIVFLGTKDKLIPVATGEKYRDTMKGLGARCDLHLYDGEPHGFFNKSKYHETVFEADRFLASLGFLKGEPTIGHPLNGK
jgi:acetyl esterase